MMNRQALPALALIALVGVAVPASAQEAMRRVSYTDLDLSRPEGATTLQHRVSGAIREVCGETDPRDLHKNRLVLQCRRDAQVTSQTQVALAVDRAQALARQSVASSEVAVR
jgi:UrcA family protein